MRAAANPGMREVQSAGTGLGLGDEIRHRLDAGVASNDQHIGRGRDRTDVDEILQRVIGQLGVHRRVIGMRRGVDQQGVAIRRRLRHQGRADSAAGTGPVLGQHLLPPGVRQLGRQRTPDDVGRAAGGERNDQAYRLVGKSGRGGLRHGRGVAQCQH